MAPASGTAGSTLPPQLAQCCLSVTAHLLCVVLTEIAKAQVSAPCCSLPHSRPAPSRRREQTLLDVGEGSFFRGPCGGVSPWAPRVTSTPSELVAEAHARFGVTDR